MPLKMTARFNAKSFVGEQKRLFAAVERGRRRGLMRGGAYVRLTARRSIKPGGKRNAISQPGEPVRWHVKPGLRNNILFAYDPRNGTVPVGPIQFRNSDVLEKLEHGGVIEVRQRVRRSGRVVIEKHVVHIRPRPTMRLALAASQGKLAEFFKDVVK